MNYRVKERGETSLLSGADGPLSHCGEFQTPYSSHITTAPIIKLRHGGAQEESKLIKKYADQWCRDNGYPIKKRRRTRYAKTQSLRSHTVL